MSLSAERCQACTGTTPVVSGEELARLRGEIDGGWEVVDGTRLRRVFRYKDFASAFAFATRVAFIAENEEHHPDICLGWGRLEVDLTTHAVKGLTRNDFILAAKIDAVSAG